MKQIYAIALALFLSACGDQNSGLDMDDFINSVENALGDEALNCGVVEIGESQVETNYCVAEAYANQTPFYAIYKLLGTDSQGATAIVYEADETLTFWNFDSDPGGGGSSNNGKITQNECVTPMLYDLSNFGYENYYNLFWCA